MNENSIKEVCGLIAESRKPGDMVSITIGSPTGENRLGITSAPSYVLDAITDNGYYLRAEFGAVVVSAMADGEGAE